MADRFPLILNTSANQIQEIASGDQLDLSGNNIANAGIITATTFVGAVTGNATGLTGNPSINITDLDVDGHTNLDNVSVSGVSTFAGNADFSSGIDVTGAITATGTITSNDITIQDQQPRLNFVDNAGSPNNDYLIQVDGGNFVIHDSTNTADKILIAAAGYIDINSNTNFAAGIDVTGNATVSGNLSVGGVLSYEDVTNVDSVGIVTARDGVFLPDLKQLKLGNTAAAPDLYIWHNSGTNNSNISNKTGDLFIQGNNGSGTVVNQIAVKSNAAVELNYQGGKRFETTGSGVNISGNLITNHSNGAIVNNGWGFLRQRFDTANYDSIKWQNAAASVDFCDIGYDIDTSTSPDSGILRLKGVGSKGRVLIIAGSVTIQFKEDREISGVGNIIPDTGSQYNIGSSSVKFANIYADTLHGNGNNLTQIVTAGSTYNSDLDTANTVAGVYRVNTGISNGHSGMTSYGTLFHANNAQDTGFQMYVNYNNGRAFLRGGNATTFNGTSGGGYVNTTWAEIAQSTQSFIPETNDSVDLGSTSKRWRNVYTNDLNLSNEGGKNKVDGTWGNYTIQEGESDLFLINNRNGKKYKFNLTEVS